MYYRSVVSSIAKRLLLLATVALLPSTGLLAGCTGIVDGGSTIDSGQSPSDSGTSPSDSGTTPDAGPNCTPETDSELCTQLGRSCGSTSQVDRCGATRTISCGTCTAPATCGGGGVPGTCGEGTCEPESDADLCTSLAKNCGTVSATDRCGEARSLECGSCSGDDTCGGGGENNVCGIAGDCIPSSTVPSGWSYLDNGSARIGINLSFGGAVGHFSVNGYNVLNSGDSGRYLQQSFYGADIGGSWHGNPWPFNPVQGGSSENDPSEVTEFCNNGNQLYAKTIPLDWGGTGVTPTIMEEWITLDGDMAVIRFRFEYQGDWDNPEKHQEVPALFVQRELEHLNYYEGNAPWTNGGLTSKVPINLELNQGNDYINFTESWLAYVNADNWGIGLYKRDEDYATCYVYSNIGNNAATSYFAFIDAFALTPGVVHDYVLYAKIGNLADIRAKFYELRQQGL